MLLSLLILDEAYLSGITSSKSRTVPPKLERELQLADNHFNHLLPFANKLMPLDQFTSDLSGYLRIAP